MTTNKTYQVAKLNFRISGEKLCREIEHIDGFAPFECRNGELSECSDRELPKRSDRELFEQNTEGIAFEFKESDNAPTLKDVQYTFSYEDITGTFGRYQEGVMLSLKPEKEEPLHLWIKEGDSSVWLCGNLSVRLYRFALWIGYGVMTLPYNTVAIHSSCIIYKNKAVLFLGESGTGKSTHTRLWREHIAGAVLLNDDSPIIRAEEGKIWAYGSPWSGKTPCYKQERYELAACVRLSQAPFNQIKRLSVLQAYGAIHPSCPPEFAYDNSLYDHISKFIDTLLCNVPFYHLACLPDKDAAQLSCKTLFGKAQ